MIRQPVDIYDAKTYSNLERWVQSVIGFLDQMPNITIPLVLCFWGSRGIGKTTLLNAIRSASALQSTLIGLWDARATSVANLAQEISSRVAQSSAQKKIVLIDNLDELLRQEDDAAFFDFEHQVIRALVERNDTLVIVTSRMELRQWREYEVRARVQSFQIQPLRNSEIESMNSYSAEQVYALTLGHPQVIHWLRDAPNLSEQVLAQKARKYFFEELNQTTQPVARASCLFPMFDVAAIRLVLPPRDENNTEGFYTSLLERMRGLAGAGLVFWSAESGSYRYADSSVRRLCARALSYDQPEEFKHIHRIAADYFQSDALRSAYLHLSLVSAIYHSAQSYVSVEPSTVGARCLEWIQTHRNQWVGANWDAAISAWETGQDDVGNVEELKLLIGNQVFEQISQMLRDASRRVPAHN